jgi:hypothetical protein
MELRLLQQLMTTLRCGVERLRIGSVALSGDFSGAARWSAAGRRQGAAVNLGHWAWELDCRRRGPNARPGSERPRSDQDFADIGLGKSAVRVLFEAAVFCSREEKRKRRRGRVSQAQASKPINRSSNQTDNRGDEPVGIR